jgi:hypothetical protein
MFFKDSLCMYYHELTYPSIYTKFAYCNYSNKNYNLYNIIVFSLW